MTLQTIFFYKKLFKDSDQLAPTLGISNRLKISLITALLVFLSACFPTPPEDDESQASFAREVIPTLLGRKATGVNEIEVIADIAELHGREKVVEMLMGEEEFIDHWSDTIIDILKVQRHAINDGVNAAQDQTCWGEPTRDTDPSIAEWVRDHDPQDPGAPTGWNMTDLLRSAIAIDDLSVVYKTYLFPLVIRRDGAGGVSSTDLTTKFNTVYLNRSVGCLRCHNPEYSTSNVEDGSGNITWQRLYSVYGHPEKALYDNYYDAAGVLGGMTSLMRTSVNQPAASGTGILPWGMDLSCATDTDSASSTNSGSPIYTGFQTVTGGGTSINFGSIDGSVNADASLWELERALHQGIEDLKDGYERFPVTTSALTADEQLYCDAVDVFSANCTTCHSGGGASAGLDLSSDPHAELVNINSAAGSSLQTIRVVPSNLATSELWSRIDSSLVGYKMPTGGSLSTAEKDAISDWITAGAPGAGFDTNNCGSTTTTSTPDVAPDEALAFLTAANAVDGIWESVMGYRLTIDHGFSRNKDQRDLLWNLTEYTFLQEDWSLKAVLNKILTSDWFARRAPRLTQLDSAYPMPPALDPWIVANPTSPPSPYLDEHKKNGKGEQVERYRVNTVLRGIASALDWKEPRRFRDSQYPTNFDEDFGQYRSPTIAGFDSINFQSLLALETEIGLCEKSGKSNNSDDWIDLAVTEINNFNSANPTAPITIGEAWSILKDRLIQDTTIQHGFPSELDGQADSLTEELAIIALFNENLGTSLNINSSTGELSTTNLESKLRESCGVIVKSPQFLLANITPRGYSDNNMPDPPRLDICLTDQGCSYASSCAHWRSALWGMGDYIACGDRTIRPSQLVYLPWLPFGEITVVERPDFTIAENIFIPEFGPIDPPPVIDAVRSDISTLTLDSIAKRENLNKKTLTKDFVNQANVDLRFKQRSQSICPKGLCGFVKKPRVDQCLNSGDRKSCSRLIAQCDPRDANSIQHCGKPMVNINDQGTHVLWAEGAVVNRTKNVKVLRLVKDKALSDKQNEVSYKLSQNNKRFVNKSTLSKLSKERFNKDILDKNKYRWRSLKQGERLQLGDIISIPSTGSLSLKVKDKIISTGKAYKNPSQVKDKPLVLSITGPSVKRMLEIPSKPNSLSVASMQAAYQKGSFESKAPSKKQWERIKRLSLNPHATNVLTYKEIVESTLDFKGTHIDDRQFNPDGSDKTKFKEKDER